MSLAKIISGGQTGVDRGALDAALERGFPCGGWCSAGRKAEDGAIPAIYPLSELDSESSRERTVRNILDSDATVIIYFNRLGGGMEQAVLHCITNHKPHKLVDGAAMDETAAGAAIREFVEAHGVEVLNITGPRSSRVPRARQYTHNTVLRLVEAFA